MPKRAGPALLQAIWEFFESVLRLEVYIDAPLWQLLMRVMGGGKTGVRGLALKWLLEYDQESDPREQRVALLGTLVAVLECGPKEDVNRESEDVKKVRALCDSLIRGDTPESKASCTKVLKSQLSLSTSRDVLALAQAVVKALNPGSEEVAWPALASWPQNYIKQLLPALAAAVKVARAEVPNAENLGEVTLICRELVNNAKAVEGLVGVVASGMEQEKGKQERKNWAVGLFAGAKKWMSHATGFVQDLSKHTPEIRDEMSPFVGAANAVVKGIQREFHRWKGMTQIRLERDFALWMEAVGGTAAKVSVTVAARTQARSQKK
jgi:hypothetical protein